MVCDPVQWGAGMRIAESTVLMSSGRNYIQTGMRAGGYAGGFMDMINAYGMRKQSTVTRDTYQAGSDTGRMGSYNLDDIGYFRGLGKITSGNLSGTGVSDFQNGTLSALLKRFGAFGMLGGAGISGYSTNMLTYSEIEETCFHAGGSALTEDGRRIDFNVDILMSRSYMEYMKVNIPTMTDALCDPLVVNIGSDTADVRDQIFKFDLDADGTEDEISMLGKDSGFLALDKNGDGKINDGSELFGAKSGDGFGDLRKYDSDGNGWIDENDEVFAKLRVWCKDEKGKDILMDLKEADIGAIYLGAQQTEFSLGGADGYRDGVIRSTGVFLRESNGTGTIQHVDLSLKQNGAGLKVSGEEAPSEAGASINRSSESNAVKRREERQRKEARARKKRADDKAYEEALYKKRREHREYLDKLQEKRFAERKAYHEELHQRLIQTP